MHTQAQFEDLSIKLFQKFARFEYALKNKLITKIETTIQLPGPVVQVSKDNNFMPSWITGRVKDWDMKFYKLPLSLTPFMWKMEFQDSTIQYNPSPIKLVIK